MKSNSAMKAQEGDCKAVFEIELAVQEWGIKNNLRLFGVFIANMDFHGYGGPAENVALRAKGFFIDPDYKTMELHIFDIKEKSGIVTIAKTKRLNGFRWPIKITRTKEFENDHIDPVGPLYWVLVDRKIILPFKSTMKQKEWAALPFEDMSGIKLMKI
jgi:hypothetical protein